MPPVISPPSLNRHERKRTHCQHCITHRCSDWPMAERTRLLDSSSSGVHSRKRLAGHTAAALHTMELHHTSRAGLVEAEPLSVQFFRTCEIEGPPRIARFNAMHARLPHFARALSENFDANLTLSLPPPQRCGGGSGPTFFFFPLLHCRQEIVGSCGLLGLLLLFFFFGAQPRARKPLAKRAKVDVSLLSTSASSCTHSHMHSLLHPRPSLPALIAPIAHPRAPQEIRHRAF